MRKNVGKLRDEPEPMPCQQAAAQRANELLLAHLFVCINDQSKATRNAKD